MVKANWSGSYPCLCHGTWILEVNGVDVSSSIPEGLRYDEMNTFGIYDTWSFDDDYMEVWEDYEDGLKCDEWIKENKYWLDTITNDSDTQIEIFNAINEEDFRRNSCGGCV